MSDIRFFSKCETCKRRRFVVKRRKVPLPMKGVTALSQKLMCSGCHKKVLEMLSTNHLAPLK